jgi:hypothetical protein
MNSRFSHVNPIDQDVRALEEWFLVYRQLMERENAFRGLALRAAAGEITPEELDAERQALNELRSLCTAVFRKAFPRDRDRNQEWEAPPPPRGARPRRDQLAELPVPPLSQLAAWAVCQGPR